MSCVAARGIVAQVTRQLVQPPEAPDEQAFAAAVIDWLDPHGLWSAAPESPVAEAIRQKAHGILDGLRGPRANCAAATRVGEVLALQVNELRAVFDRSRTKLRESLLAAGPHAAPESNRQREAFFEPVFEAGELSRPASELANLLGEQAGAFDASGVTGAMGMVDAARDRFFPPLAAEGWGDVVLAAAVRAYVPAVDPHGQWAPFEEEASLYESELEAKPPPPFWDSITRTAVGVRVDSEPLPPLAVGDLVLSVEGVSLGGMPLEQIEQLAYTLADERQHVSMLVLSRGQNAARAISVALPEAEAMAATREGLATESVHYGDSRVLVVGIRDVREDLGDELSHELQRAKGDSPLAGVILDLRGNGGGSTDGAASALGLFLSGAPLFPMRRRDGTLEIDRATEPSPGERWEGPVAALVDRSTASAAEMIAGAIGAYHRGVVIGERTFGKGCAQEYIEDESDVGVLRLTTLVFALPDGSPLQRTGILPSILVPFGESGVNETESSLRGSPAAFRGPDIRDSRRVAMLASQAAWPAIRTVRDGTLADGPDVGPCKEPDLCRGLRALAATTTRRAAKR